jgi:hypothetical protein
MSEDTTPHTHDDGTEHVQEEAPKALTGFAIFITKEGNVILERNPAVLTIEVEREASLMDVRRCVSEVLMDLQAQTAAEYTTLRLAAIESAKMEAPEETPAEQE